jgi:hypothetical protein
MSKKKNRKRELGVPSFIHFSKGGTSFWEFLDFRKYLVGNESRIQKNGKMPRGGRDCKIFGK